MFSRRPERNALPAEADGYATLDPPTPPRPLMHFHSVSLSDLDASDRSPQCYAALLVVAYFAVGVFYYSYLAAPATFTLIDALYFTVVTITTVGYGDFSPTNWLSRIFLTYVFVHGIVFFSEEIRKFIELS